MWIATITNIKTGEVWGAGSTYVTEELAQAWLNKQSGKPGRLPERIVSMDEEYDQADVLEVIETEQEQFDAGGNSTGMAMVQTHVRLRAQFTSEIVDISAQVASEAAQAAARKLLADTDFMVIRHLGQKALNTATSLSEEEYLQLEQQRQQARSSIA